MIKVETSLKVEVSDHSALWGCALVAILAFFAVIGIYIFYG